MLLCGTAGTGKTTVAKALCNELGCDYIVINGSDESGIDGLRTTISRQLRETQKCRVPTILTLKLKISPPREESTQIIFGKEKKVKAKPEMKRIIIAPLKELKDGVQ